MLAMAYHQVRRRAVRMTATVQPAPSIGDKRFDTYIEMILKQMMADGSGKIAWQNNTRVYVPSMIAKAGQVLKAARISLLAAVGMPDFACATGPPALRPYCGTFFDACALTPNGTVRLMMITLGAVAAVSRAELHTHVAF